MSLPIMQIPLQHTKNGANKIEIDILSLRRFTTCGQSDKTNESSSYHSRSIRNYLAKNNENWSKTTLYNWNSTKFVPEEEQQQPTANKSNEYSPLVN